MKTPTLLLVLGLSLTATGRAQSATQPNPNVGSDDQPIQLDSFVVTGSNIRRVDTETALPVSVITATELDARGASTMAELMETLNAAELSGITEINTGAQAARGDVASIDLRGLGSGSSLVLINGRRMVPHPISMAENGVPSLAPNINGVPRALVDRIEVLRDGASAIYGADAAAGVVNNIISRSFVGRSLRLRNSVTQHGGGAEFGVTYAEGFNAGKTHVSLSFDYFHRDRLDARERGWASQYDTRLNGRVPAPWDGRPIVDANGTTVRDNDFANTIGQGQWTNQWVRGFIQPDYLTFSGSRPTGNVGITTSTTPPPGVATTAANGAFFLYPDASGRISFRQSTPSKNIDSPDNALYENLNNYRSLFPETDRFQIGAFIDRPLTDRVTFFGDMLLYAAHSSTMSEPTNFKNTDDRGIYVPANNPWNPFGERFYHPTGAPNPDGTPRLVGTPADVTPSVGLRSMDFAEREVEVQSYAWRLLSGLRGKFADTWEWESALTLSGAQTNEYWHNMLRESRVRQALSRSDNTALNPFGTTFKIENGLIVTDQIFRNPSAVIDALYDSEKRFGRTGLYIWDAKANGRLWRLFGGGDIGVATGVEMRYETYQDKRPVYVGRNPPGAGELFPFFRENDNDFIALSANAPIDADQFIYAAYAEVALPFVTRENRKPLIDALELSLAGRFEHFSIFGQTTKPKASLVWNPFRRLKFRGSIAESFRAPNLVQTSVTPLSRQISAEDSYRYDVTGAIVDSNSLRNTIRQGNENLQPEQAQTWAAGFVFEVPKVRGLSVTFDYFHINQNKAIENVGAAATLRRDELLLDLATQAALAAGTPIDQIDLGSGTANYKGNSKVVRKPVTDVDRALFAAYNAAQPTNATKRAPVGDYVTLYDDYINLSGRDIEGYEFGILWNSPRTRFGQFRFSGEATHYLVRKSQEEDGAVALSELEKDGRTKWRANATVSWRQGAWSAGWFTSYFGSFVDTSAATTEPVWQALGHPSYIRVFNDNGIVRYLYKVEPYIQHNAWMGYRFRGETHRWLKGVSLRVAMNNVFDTEPPLADEAYGFRTGSANPRGRQFAFELGRSF